MEKVKQFRKKEDVHMCIVAPISKKQKKRVWGMLKSRFILDTTNREYKKRKAQE
jgi:hypothetical protein